MTVGIALCPGKRLEAIVMTDSRVSMNGRQSDSATKFGEFYSPDFHGVIFGSGDGQLIEGTIKTLSEIHGDDLDKYVKNLYYSIRKGQDFTDNIHIESQRIEVMKKAALIRPEALLPQIINSASAFQDAAEKKEFIEKRMNDTQQKYEVQLQEEFVRIKRDYETFKQQAYTKFLLVAYDSSKEKIRSFHITSNVFEELFIDHIEIGSGADGANMYFSEVLQGMNGNSDFSTADMVFLAVNAYNHSTVNRGVGGTPKIVKVSKDPNKVIDVDKTRALVNLSGAHLSRVYEDALTNGKTRVMMKGILEGRKGVYEKIAKSTGLNTETLTTTLIPYSSWQERANRVLFG